MNVFISYSFKDEASRAFGPLLARFLKSQGLRVFFYEDEVFRHPHQKWQEWLEARLQEAQCFLFLLGSTLGQVHVDEALAANVLSDVTRIRIDLPGADSAGFEQRAPTVGGGWKFKATVAAKDGTAMESALVCAIEVCKRGLGLPWDDVPHGHPFTYEKEIIKRYLDLPKNPSASDLAWLIERGCPRAWPQVRHIDQNKQRLPNALGIKTFSDDHNVLAAADLECSPQGQIDREMTFRMAGPRNALFWGERGRVLNVGLLVSGGIAPGINAVIAAIANRHWQYAQKGGYSCKVTGFLDGFSSLAGQPSQTEILPSTVENISNKGGSILGTSRVPEFVLSEVREQALGSAVARLVNGNPPIDILYIIGGDGSMRAAHALYERLSHRDPRERPIAVVAVPKTMDNDVLWGWQTFGFVSAVEDADNIIRHLWTEATSNPRLCVLQLFGSDSGYVVTHAALAASGACDLFLIPEIPFTLASVVTHVVKKLSARFRQPHRRSYGLVLMGETAVPLDAMRYLNDRRWTKLGLSGDETAAVKEYLQPKGFALGPQAQQYLGMQPGARQPITDEVKNEIRTFARTLRTPGQTPDDLRSACLKLVTRVLRQKIADDGSESVRDEECWATLDNMKDPYWKDFRAFANEPRHLLRAVEPRSSDILFSQRLGTLAVDGAMAGYTDFMISQWLTEYVMVPLQLVVLGRKRVPAEGIFYQSAIESTGQPKDLLFS